MITAPPYRFALPSAPLADVVEVYWIHEGAPPLHAFERVLPGGREELIINLTDGELRCYHEDGSPNGRTSGPLLVGLHRSAYTIDTRQKTAVLGARLKPGGLWKLFGISANEFKESRLALHSFLGRGTDHLMERLLEATQAEQRFRLLDTALTARRLRDLHPAVSWAAQQIIRYNDRVSVAALAEESGLSVRRFGSLFQREIGLAPKSYARLRRFERALREVHAHRSPDWCELAASLGYADQAHFIREFREFSGLTPATYHARRGPNPNFVVTRETENAAA